MKIAKKTLSVFLAFLMLFSACSVGLTGVVSFAAENNSKYTAEEVIDLINKAIANGYSAKSSGGKTNITGDDGSVINAAEAIYDYAIKNYRTSKKADASYNATTTICERFISDFTGRFSGTTAQNAMKALATDVLNPNGGTTIYGYESRLTGTPYTASKEYNSTSTGSKDYPIANETEAKNYVENNNLYNASVSKSVITKTVNVTVDIEKLLMNYDKISDIPTTLITDISYTYSHAFGSSVTLTNSDGSSGSGTKKKDIRTSTITNQAWNYMSGKPVRLITKDKTVKKQLVAFEKYFTQETLNMTLEDMLAIPLEDLAAEVTLAAGYAEAIETTFSDAILTHFKLDPAKIAAYVENLEFAYSVIAGMDAIDTILANVEALRNEDADNDGIGDGYNVESYAEMAELYTKANSAYEVVSTMQGATADYIVNNMDYAQQYADVQAILAETSALLTVLHDIMTEQRLEELVASMVAIYNEYNDKLDKENFEIPTDDEVINLGQQVNAYEDILATYTGYSYYKTYFPADYETAWNAFGAELDEVVEARNLKIDYEDNFYNFFYPILYTTAIVDLDDEGAMALYEEFETRLTEATQYYNSIVAKYNNSYTIANNIFMLNYEGKDDLLQNHVTNSKSAGLAAVKDNLVDRAEADLDAIESYKNVTTVDFTNFAEIKSTLSHFNQDLYDYVTGGNRDKANWLSTDYQNKYSQVQTLLDKYHAFSTSNGKTSYDALKKDFGYADANGIYATRLAGSRTVEVEGEDDDGNPVIVEQQVGYPNDIARDGAEDDYVVTKNLLEGTVVKLDKFLASRDFGALLGFEDEDTEEATDLKTYVQQMINNNLFTSDLLNSLVTMIYPMVTDLLETELPKALADMGTPNDPGASAAIDAGTLTDLLDGTLNIYIDDDEKTADNNWNGHHQRYLYEVFESAELYIYPRSFAKYLNISNPAIFHEGNELYDQLMLADRSWKYFELQEDLVDEEGELVAEAGTVYLDYDWQINGDREMFLECMSYILDSILPLLQTLMLGSTFSEELSNAAYVWGYVDIPILGENQLGGYGNLTLNISSADSDGNTYSVWNSVIVPLFQLLGVTNIPTLKAGFSGEDLANALLGTLLTRVDEILASPIDNVLEILPNLVYFVSMDSVQEIINDINININLGIGVEINADDSGAIGDILGWLGNDAFDFLDNLTSFDLGLKISDLVDLYDMLGFEISDFNDILGALTSSMGLELPKIRQQDIILCSTWSTFSNGDVNLVADKAELLYWLLSFAVEAIQSGLLDSLLGGSEMDPTIKALLDKIVYQFSNNTDGAVAAIIELLNPTTYDLEGMDWIEQGAWNYNDIEGTNQMSIVYLNYGNDWTRADAEYLVDNVDSIVKTVLDLAGVEGMDDLGAYLKDTVNGLFTNANITALVEMLGGLGDSPSAVILDVVANQIGIDLESWFIAYGYLYPAETWADDAEVIRRDSQFYVNNFGVEGVANEDGTITWMFNRMPLVDGDGYTFINILTRLLGGMELAIEFLFAGADISAFENVLTIKGYDTYDNTFGLLLEMLGVQNLPTQADFKADAMGSFANMLYAVLDWFYALTESGNMIAQLMEIIPDVFYYIESNGLSTLLKNLLMPVLVLVDTVRPLFDVDLNGVLSYIVSDFLNYSTIDLDGLLQVLIYGNNPHFGDIDYVWYSVDVMNLTLSEILKIADKWIGTDLYASGLVQIGLKGLCSGVESATGAIGNYYRTTVDAADTITILVTAFIDCLAYPAQDKTKTNGDAVFEFIAELTEKPELAGLYGSISEILAGIDYEYDFPNWGYMFGEGDIFTPDTLPAQSIVYLGYTTDWDKDAADKVYGSLDEILDLVLPMVLEEGETISTLLNGVLEDNVYSDEILNTVVEALVGLLAGLDRTLFELVDVVVATDITAWFAMCDITTDENGETVVTCNKDWGVDEAAAEDKKDKFIAGIKDVLAPANSLLSWLFFGTEYSFFTSSEVDAEGNYTYADLITLNGGEGYAYGLVPLLEALGCEMAPASAYYDAATGTYNVGNAVEGILNSVLALVDEVSANPVEEVFNLLPNLIYFINADGAKVVVNNLLAPVNAIVEKLSPVIGEVSITGLLTETIGFDIADIEMDTLLQIAVDNGIVLNDSIVTILSSLYVGKLVEFDSANGSKAYRLDVTGYEGDVLTIVLSLALDLFNINADLFAGLLGEDIYWTVYNLIRGATDEFTYRDLNWGYMYEGETNADKLAALEAANGKLPERTNEAYDVYTLYQNNWNKQTADYVSVVVDTLVHDITTAVTDNGSTLGQILDEAIADGLYQDSLVNDLIELVVDLLVDYVDLIEGAGVLLGAESIVNWIDYCEITEDENGERVVTCTHDWGIDEAETIDEKRTRFINAFATVLEPTYEVLAWLFFGEDFTFFNGTTNEELITIKGGYGYTEALVPLFEAVGVLMRRDANGDLLSVEETYLKGESAVLPASYFYVDGKLDMKLAVTTIFTALSDWLYDICGDLADPSTDGVITSMLERLPNVLYAVNADGLVAVVNNLVAPAMFLLEALEPMIGEIDFNELIGIEGMDIFNFQFDDLFALLENEDVLGLYFPDYTQEFLKTFYIGELVDYTSASGETAYYMTYTDEESEAEMLTCLIGFVVDAFQDPRNKTCLVDWFNGEDVYNGIMAVLGLNGVKDMQDFNWLYTEYADTEHEFNATESSVKYDVAYNTIWTRDKAEYISQNIIPFVNNILGLIGLELNGVEIKDIDNLLDSLLEGNLYTQATVDSLLELVRDLISKLTGLEPYGEYIIGILDKAFGVDLSAWDNMNLVVEDGNRDSFVAALSEIVAPIVPLLDVLLCGENIELFYSIAPEKVGESALIIYGSEGYAYGLVPLFEALGCEMMAPEAFKALDDEAKVAAILDALVARIDVILTDPVTEIFKMIPELVYFINSNGLDTAVNNILNSVDTVLIALEPLLGATSLMELLGVDLAEYNMDYLINMACEAIEDSTGLDCEPLLVDFIAELTMGKVVSYQSANGETYYKMVYANEDQMTDMVTVILRLAIDFLATGENADAIIALIANNSESEDAANSASTLISFVLTAANTEPVTSGAMAVLYYIFYGLNEGVGGIDYLYGNYGESWDALVGFFEESEESYMVKAAEVLKAILREIGGVDTDSSVDNCDCDCHNNSGFVRFFFKIITFLRKLFGMKQFQICECGAAHW